MQLYTYKKYETRPDLEGKAQENTKIEKNQYRRVCLNGLILFVHFVSYVHSQTIPYRQKLIASDS